MTELVQYRGVCPYCGQIAMVKGVKGLQEEQINYLAMMECDCERAELEQLIVRKQSAANANIELLLKEDGENIVEACKALTRILAEQKMKKISLITSRGVRVTLESREKTIRIRRQEVIQKQMED